MASVSPTWWCGKGRFARIVKERNPSASVLALDLAEAMLLPIPSDIERVAASMTALPPATGTFDGRLRYRVAGTRRGRSRGGGRTRKNRPKPGGRIVIIDKNAEAWGRLKTPEWEQWFGRKELEKLLSRHCREVTSLLAFLLGRRGTGRNVLGLASC